MKRAPLVALGFVSLIPSVVSFACGGKIAADADGGPMPIDAPGLSSKWPPCPADSTPPPVLAHAEVAVVGACTRLCNRNFDCERCTYASCLPTCIVDSTAGQCPAPYASWLACFVEHVGESCGSPRACDSTYCDYLRCADPSSPLPPICG